MLNGPQQSSLLLRFKKKKRNPLATNKLLKWKNNFVNTGIFPGQGAVSPFYLGKKRSFSKSKSDGEKEKAEKHLICACAADCLISVVKY